MKFAAKPSRSPQQSAAPLERGLAKLRKSMKSRTVLPMLAVFPLLACSNTSLNDELLYSSLADSDISIAANNLQHGLETGRQGDVHRWDNPQTGNQGAIAIGRTFKDRAGNYCRDYSETIELADGRSSSYDNTACRGEDAAWRWI